MHKCGLEVSAIVIVVRIELFEFVDIDVLSFLIQLLKFASHLLEVGLLSSGWFTVYVLNCLVEKAAEIIETLYVGLYGVELIKSFIFTIVLGFTTILLSIYLNKVDGLLVLLIFNCNF